MKKFTMSCILTGILLTAFLVLSSSSSSCSKANLMPEETLDDDTGETDDSAVPSESEIDEALYIFLSSPYGSALLAATEEDLGSIPGLESPGTDKSLNEIRFDGWTEEDFFNNDYLRAFRRYMDAWLQGKEMDDKEADPSALEPYRERLRGKFFASQVREFPFGGLLYTLIPIDEPALFLRVWIYSTVNDSHIDEYLVEHVEVERDFEEEYTIDEVGKDVLRQALLEYIEGAYLW